MNRKDNKLVFREGPIQDHLDSKAVIFPVERMDNAGGVDLVMGIFDTGDDGSQDAETISVDLHTRAAGGTWAKKFTFWTGTVADLKLAGLENENGEYRIGLRRQLGQENKIVFVYGGLELANIDLIVFLEPEV